MQIDAIKSKRKLLDVARLLTESCLKGKPFYKKEMNTKEVSEYKGWPNFSEVFMVSALTGLIAIQQKHLCFYLTLKLQVMVC